MTALYYTRDRYQDQHRHQATATKRGGSDIVAFSSRVVFSTGVCKTLGIISGVDA